MPVILLLNHQDMLAKKISIDTPDDELDSFIEYFSTFDTQSNKTSLNNLILFLVDEDPVNRDKITQVKLIIINRFNVRSFRFF